MSLRDDLIAAKALIDTPEKWAQSPRVGPNGEMCALRACEAAVGVFPTRWETSGRAMDALGALNDAAAAFGHICVTYNDHPDTTHADVMALFDRAIAATPSIDMSKQGAGDAHG